MNIRVLTSLYPSPARPHEGIFAERRWTGMRARGHSVSIVHPRPWTPPPLPLFSADWRAIAASPPIEERSGIAVRRPRYLHLPRFPRWNALRFSRRGVRELLAEPRPDVVVADYAWPAAAAAPALDAARMPFAVCGRGSDVLEVAGEAGLAVELRRHLRIAGNWFAVSRDLVEAMDRLTGRPGRGVLVPNGVDLVTFRPQDRRAARRRLGLPEGPPLVLVAGHLIPRKDPLLALAAFRSGAPPDAHLAFVGAGPLAEELGGAIAAAGLAGRARLFGEAPPERLADWYAACDLLLLTSRREGRPNVVLEALASGRPVVATRAGGTAELLEGQEGALAPDRDPKAVGALVAARLAAPPDPEKLRSGVAPLSWEASLETLEGCLERAASFRSP